jgi:hypothetical protein
VVILRKEEGSECAAINASDGYVMIHGLRFALRLAMASGGVIFPCT